MNTLTIDGNLTEDPALRFIPSGQAVVNFTVAHTPRRMNKQTQQWEDGETVFLRCSMWRDAAENVAESLTRGTKVLVTGKLVARSWDDKTSGEKRTVMELDVEDIGPSLQRATAKVTKAARGNSGGFNPAPKVTTAPADDPWATNAKPVYDEPPF